MFHTLHWTMVLVPVVLLPFAVLLLGINWLLASLGVYLRDISQLMPPLIMVLLFLSPILYPLSSLPEIARFLLYFNPLTVVVEQLREVLIWGRLPDFMHLGWYFLASSLLAAFSFAWFQKTRRGFADVL